MKREVEELRELVARFSRLSEFRKTSIFAYVVGYMDSNEHAIQSLKQQLELEEGFARKYGN